MILIIVRGADRPRFEPADYAELLGLYLDLFVRTCRLVDVECRRSVRIYRRASVALMLEHVGIKE
jgi:hypothetical protein